MKAIADMIEEILIRDYKKFYRLAFSYTKNEQDALDVVQEGAYKAVKNCSKVKSPEYIFTWIYRIMINEALVILRERKKITPLYTEDDTGAVDNYEDIDLSKAMENLDFTDQSIIKLRFFEDLPLKTIGEILDLKENTVKTRLYRALDKLKIKMENNNYGKEYGIN